MSENMWGIHAGSAGEADSLFLKKAVIAIGWEDLGDLSKIESNRDAFKEAFAKAYPNSKPMAIAVKAGLLYRFANEMQRKELVIYPSKIDRQIHIGEIEGDYNYNPSMNEDYPHGRKVKWLKHLQRTHFSQGALYEIGSMVTLFQVRNYSDEFYNVLQDKPIVPEGPEPAPQIANTIEENTRTFIIQKLSQELKGHPFANFIAHLLNKMGFKTRISPEGPDGGIDIIAHRDELGFEPPIVKVQVKSSESNVGDPVVSALYGKVGQDEHGLLVTLGSYTSQAKRFAREKTNLRLIDGEELVELILLHYEKLDSKYKGILPLKSIYVPESFIES